MRTCAPHGKPPFEGAAGAQDGVLAASKRKPAAGGAAELADEAPKSPPPLLQDGVLAANREPGAGKTALDAVPAANKGGVSTCALGAARGTNRKPVILVALLLLLSSDC